MKRNIFYTGLIAATTLLTFASCYDLDEMSRDPYGVDGSENAGGEITPDKPDEGKYADININYAVSHDDSLAYKKALADAPATFRTFLYQGYYNDYQITTNLSHDIYAGYVANNQPKHAKKSPDYGYSDGWSGRRWSHFYTERSTEYRDLLRAYKFNDTPEKYRNMYYITRIYYAFLALANTDTYGDMPFRQYVQAKVPETNNVEYDTQEQVYDAMFRMLEQAVDSIKPEDASQYKIDKDDICYFGDAEKWCRFANSMRLRMALRISNVNPERAKKEAEAALNNKYGLMKSNDDNMQTVPKHAPVEMGGEDGGGDENGLAMCSVAYGGESVLSKDMENLYRNLSDGGKEYTIKKTNFDAFIQAVGSEIEQAQVRLIVAANAQMLFHYWKIGNYILYHQQLHGWGSKIIKQLAKAIRLHYPEKKGYSERNLTYMCQFAKAYPLRALQSFIETDASLSVPTIQSVTNEVLKLNDKQFTQELTAQIQSIDCQSLAITQEVPAQFEDVGKTVSAIYRMGIREIEEVFLTSPIAKINWTSQMTILDSSLPLGLSYWYMKQSVEMGWSSNVLKMQIDSDLYSRQISNNKVNNFTTTLPAPQSDLANYLLKDPYIFDLAGAKEKADERDIEEQLVKHVTRYLLEMGNGFAFVARQKHFQVGNSDFFADLILYSIPLHAYIVIELKATPFKPEYAGQLNFYINVVDDKLRGEHDNKTIGLLLCRGKDEVVAQYALSGYDQPIGISDYQLSKAIPEKLKSALPSVEEVEEELASFLDKDPQ